MDLAELGRHIEEAMRAGEMVVQTHDAGGPYTECFALLLMPKHQLFLHLGNEKSIRRDVDVPPDLHTISLSRGMPPIWEITGEGRSGIMIRADTPGEAIAAYTKSLPMSAVPQTITVSRVVE